jgi:hypothetical protein
VAGPAERRDAAGARGLQGARGARAAAGLTPPRDGVPDRARRPGGRRARGQRAAEPEDAERAELEAARDAKYREIRDAELDYRVGKLSDADWRALDRDLRAEAVEILRRLDELS